MYQIIGETIWVAGVYKHAQFTPKKFKWRQREFSITQITLISDTRDGTVKKRLYSVVSGNEVYRLEFNRESEQWYLQELWVE